MSIPSCFNVIQPFGFIAINYERLRTIAQRNLIHIYPHHQRKEWIRLKYRIIWIYISL
jgi:hypothetical protein